MATLMQAYTIMLGDVTAADCSARQIGGIEQWQEAVLAAVAAAMACDPPGRAGMSVAVTSSSTHRGWRIAAGFIVAALADQIAEAEYRIAESVAKERKLRAEAEAHDEMARRLEQQAAAAEGQAAMLMARASAARSAASAAASEKGGEAAAAASTAEAESCEAAAAAASGEAAACRAAAAWHRMQAQLCREEADVERGRQALLRAWLAAALDAQQIGQRLIAQENVIAFPIGEAIAAAGGLHEVAANKRYFVR